jgi:pimeloyl-ACP methyl ester carboxylesterase
VRSAAAVTLLCALACVAATRPAAAGEAQLAGKAPEAVVLLHGLYRSERSMRPLAARLAEEGYQVHSLRYASTRGAPDELEGQIREQLARCCAGAPRLHFVTHSLGGILVRALLARHQLPNLGRVVMLAPPNHGSELVDWFGGALGPTGRELGTQPGSLPDRLPPPDFPLGVIAGTLSLNPIGSLVLPGASDGTVAVTSTWIEGMSDFVAVPATHSLILRSGAAAEHVVEFLREGHFEVARP